MWVIADTYLSWLCILCDIIRAKARVNLACLGRMIALSAVDDQVAALASCEKVSRVPGFLAVLCGTVHAQPGGSINVQQPRIAQRAIAICACIQNRLHIAPGAVSFATQLVRQCSLILRDMQCHMCMPGHSILCPSPSGSAMLLFDSSTLIKLGVCFECQNQ